MLVRSQRIQAGEFAERVYDSLASSYPEHVRTRLEEFLSLYSSPDGSSLSPVAQVALGRHILLDLVALEGGRPFHTYSDAEIFTELGHVDVARSPNLEHYLATLGVFIFEQLRGFDSHGRAEFARFAVR